MAEPLWKIKGQWLKNCNCDFGCPCDFNAKPTRGDCEGMLAMKIEDGYFKDISLSGLHWAAMYRWPGALHEGNGTMLPIIDEKADENQRNALLTILSGQEQEKTTMYFIMTQIVTTVLEPQFLPIEFEFDMKARTARVKVDGLIETVSEPIKNPCFRRPSPNSGKYARRI